MRSRNLSCIEENAKNDIQGFIMLIQICACCGREFTYRRGRKHCSSCQGLLKTKIIVQKTLPSPLLET